MVTPKPYVIAKTPSSNITRQHKVGGKWRQTACGWDTSLWSVHFMAERIEVIACRSTGCREKA